MTDTPGRFRQMAAEVIGGIEDRWCGNTDSAKARREADAGQKMDQAMRLLAVIGAQHRLDQTLGRDFTPPPPIKDFLSYGQVLVRAIEMLNARPYGRWTVQWSPGRIVVTPPVGAEIVYPSDDLGGYFGDPRDKEDLDRRAETMALGLARSVRWGIDAERSRDTLRFKSMHLSLNENAWASVCSGDIIHMEPDDPLAVEPVRFVVYYVDPYLLFLVREDGEMLSPEFPPDPDKWRLLWKELPSVSIGCINDDCEEYRDVRCPVCKAFIDADQLWAHTHWEHVREWRKERL